MHNTTQKDNHMYFDDSKIPVTPKGPGGLSALETPHTPSHNLSPFTFAHNHSQEKDVELVLRLTSPSPDTDKLGTKTRTHPESPLQNRGVRARNLPKRPHPYANGLATPGPSPDKARRRNVVVQEESERRQDAERQPQLAQDSDDTTRHEAEVSRMDPGEVARQRQKEAEARLQEALAQQASLAATIREREEQLRKREEAALRLQEEAIQQKETAVTMREQALRVSIEEKNQAGRKEEERQEREENDRLEREKTVRNANDRAEAAAGLAVEAQLRLKNEIRARREAEMEAEKARAYADSQVKLAQGEKEKAELQIRQLEDQARQYQERERLQAEELQRQRAMYLEHIRQVEAESMRNIEEYRRRVEQENIAQGQRYSESLTVEQQRLQQVRAELEARASEFAWYRQQYQQQFCSMGPPQQLAPVPFSFSVNPLHPPQHQLGCGYTGSQYHQPFPIPPDQVAMDLDVSLRQPATTFNMDCSTPSFDSFPVSSLILPQSFDPLPQVTVEQRFAEYDGKLAGLKPKAGKASMINFASIPWPVLCDIHGPEDITLPRVHQFFSHPDRPIKGTAAKQLKYDLAFWHPDRFREIIRNRVDVLVEQEILQAAGVIGRYLTEKSK